MMYGFLKIDINYLLNTFTPRHTTLALNVLSPKNVFEQKYKSWSDGKLAVCSGVGLFASQIAFCLTFEFFVLLFIFDCSK